MSISDTITSIENHLSADYEGLTNLGIDLTGINKNIENIKPCLDTIWNNLPKVSDTGTEVTLSPTLKGKLGIIPKGNSSQEGEPTPSTPIPIKSVTGNNNVVVTHQLFTSYIEQGALVNANGQEATSDKRIRSYGYIDVEAETTYNIDCDNASLYYARIFYYKSDSTFISNSGASTVPKTFKTPANTAKVRFVFQYKTEENITPSDISGVVFYKDRVTKPLNLGSIELNKIGNYQDYIYKNNGNWYKHEEIGKVVFTGAVTENWTKITNYNMYSFSTYDTKANIGPDTLVGVYCDYFKELTGNEINNRNQGITVGTNGAFYFYIDACETLEDWKTWLGSNNIEVKYPLVTPTDIEITDTQLIEQLEDIDKMQSYNGTTIITSTYDSNNAQMILEVSSLKGE